MTPKLLRNPQGLGELFGILSRQVYWTVNEETASNHRVRCGLETEED
jgi:hypothetical protein